MITINALTIIVFLIIFLTAIASGAGITVFVISKMAKKIYDEGMVYKTYLSFKNENEERMAIAEMLLWKYNTKGIPPDVFERLIANKFMRKNQHDECYGWTPVTDKIGQKFNKAFGFK